MPRVADIHDICRQIDLFALNHIYFKATKYHKFLMNFDSYQSFKEIKDIHIDVIGTPR